MDNAFGAYQCCSGIPRVCYEEYWINIARMQGTEWKSLYATQIQLRPDIEVFLKHPFYIDEQGPPYHTYQFALSTNSLSPVSVSLSILSSTSLFRYSVLLAGFILLGVYVLIVFELLHRFEIVKSCVDYHVEH